MFVLLMGYACTAGQPIDPLITEYQHLNVIDIHNHDADTAAHYQASLKIWDAYGIDRVVLFGAISEPAAVETDRIAWEAYRAYPERFYPFFAGFDIQNPKCLEIVEKNLEQGYYGIGEFVAASTYSPMTSRLPWKGKHPMDSYFPQVYALAARYKVPLLLHIDPPNGFPIQRLKEALAAYPDTIFIFAHANAYNAAILQEALLQEFPNLYLDFFAGFTAYNPDSRETLMNYVPLIETYPTRVFVSSDSGYGLGYQKAYQAIYQLFDLLDQEIVELIAWKNFANLIEAQPMTAYQAQRIRELSEQHDIAVDWTHFNKRQANEWIITIEQE